MVTTRVSKRKANERPKRQRRASTKFGEASSGTSVGEEPPSNNKPKQEKNKKKRVDAPVITPKKTTGTQSAQKKKKNRNNRGQEKTKKTATSKVVAKVAKVKNDTKNDTPAPKNAKRKTTEDINDGESSKKKEVRVKVRLDEKLNKGYRFAWVNTSSSSIKKKADKVEKKRSVAKRGKPTVKQTVAGGGDTRYQTIRVRVRVEMDARVRVRLNKKLLKGDRTALINDCVMNHDDGDGQLIAIQKKKSPKITIRVGKKNEEGQHKNSNDVTVNEEKIVKRKQGDANEEKKGSDVDSQQQQQQQQSPPPKKVKISQFGNDIDPKRLCIIDGCEKYKKARCGGHCLSHYERLSDAEKEEIAKENELKKLKVAPEKKRCKVKGCTKYFKSKHDGFCLTCYREHQDGKKTADMTRDDEDERSLPITSTAMASEGTKSAKHCNFEGCMRYKQKGCIGYCLTHKQFADPEQRRLENEVAAAQSAIKKKANKSSLCKFVGCDKYKQANCNGYCLQHVKAKKAYEDDDLEDVTKVRVRCETRLQNGFCVAILSDDDRTKLGLERPPSIADEDEDGDYHHDDEDDVEMDTSSTASSAGRPDFEVSTDIRRKENGALLCKAVGCPKIAQTKDNGFCRTHYNRFMISTGQCESWECKCGEKIATSSLRCGKCHRWKDGHHPASSSPQKSPGVASSNKPMTRIPENSGVEISNVILKNERGRPLCKVIGCGKAEQAHNDGFCRTHFNEFAILSDDAEDEKWTCECGEEWSIRNKRCGNTSCQKVGSFFL